MLATHPPYALAPTGFRFPGLAALAGRAALGGQREVVLATYLAARLAHDVLPERELAQPSRAERAASAKTWLSTVTLSGAVRAALLRLVDASGHDRQGVAEALRGVITVTAILLDSRARLELDQLASALERP